MLYHQIIAFLLIGILCNVLLNLRTLRRAEAGGELPDPPPLISVLIPARNEEANIGTCLDSLRRQDYPNFEILVLDDSSSDGTADIVSGVAAEDPRVRLLKGEPLPPGWAGKPFACHQLSQEARGSWLLFTDADTVHAPSALSYVLCAAISSQSALVSGFPLQRTTSFWQKMTMPLFFYFLLLCGLPFWWLQRSRARPMPSLAIGQFMFFSAPEYQSIGGHEAVKSHIIEDVELGMEIWRHKYRQLTLDLTPLVSCQMYREFGSMWQGINRWLYTVASMSVFALVVLMAAVIFLFLLPFVWLAYGLLLAGPLFWIVLQVVVLLAARFLAGRRFSQPLSSTILHPFAIGFVLLISFYATYQYMIGAGVRWKGRVYDSKFKIS